MLAGSRRDKDHNRTAGTEVTTKRIKHLNISHDIKTLKIDLSIKKD